MSPVNPSPKKRSARKSAVAIRYDRDSMPAPKVVAKGRGIIAERLIALAYENNIPIVEDRLLVEMLEKVGLEQNIPGEMYQVVAEILVAVYKTESKLKKRN
jgi:flagellar biosynthesis protein